nr:MAG TPA: hypothetical protein [Caudoviricetes sp.]
MVKSYRGKEVDIVSLAKKNEKTVALGNAHMNGRGDRLGRGGKIIETREEMLEKYYNANTIQQATVNMKDNIEENAKIEDELKDMTVESLIKNQTIKVAKPSKKKIEATDENETKEEN